MSRTRLPPVIATHSLGTLVRGAFRSVSPAFRAGVTAEVTRYCEGRISVLTDGATSALAHALRIAAGVGRVVALPGFGCVDLVAAAVFAQVAVVTYDVDPATLTPDLDSVRKAIASGVNALVIAPLYGFPVDIDAVRSLTAPAGVTLIEDAAQGAGGEWQGCRIGAAGDLVVMSFGRGKGLSAGRGGALVSRSEQFDTAVCELEARLHGRSAGWRDWAVSAAVWALARPSLYAIPSSIPFLRLGEMVFHEAQAPQPMADRSVAMLPEALYASRLAAMNRGRTASRLHAALQQVGHTALPRPLAGGSAGWLRCPLLDSGNRGAAPSIGIVRSYPVPVRAMPEGRALMRDLNVREPGADQLARTLVTLPTHRFVTKTVIDEIRAWASS